MKKHAFHQLVTASYGYLALPYFIFLLGWLKAPIAILLSIGLAASIWQVLAALARNPNLQEFTRTWWEKQNRWDWVALFAGSLLIIGVSGVGGWGIQSGDWTKHNGILGDLIAHPLPVYYEFYGTPVALVYYIAYYLPAAIVGKLFGSFWGGQALALWTLAGYLLSTLWLSLLSQKRLWWAVVVLGMFSGLSVVGYLLVRPLNDFFFGEPVKAYQSFASLQLYTWARNMQYSPHMVQIIWVPQHALPAWLATSLLVATALKERGRGSVLLVWALTPLWSVFVTVGLVPFLLAGILPRDRLSLRERIRGHLSWANLFGVLLMGVMLLYYATKIVDFSIMFGEPVRSGTILEEMRRWNGPLAMVLAYLLFCLIEFGIYFLIDRFHSFRNDRRIWWTYIGVALFLSVLPFFVYGKHNDLVMRASIPGLYFVALIVARNGFVMEGVRRSRQIAWALTLLIGFAVGLQLLVQQIHKSAVEGYFHFEEIVETTPVDEQFVSRFDLLDQYVSSIDTPFFQFLARTLPEDDPTAYDPVLFGGAMVLMDKVVDRTSVEAGESIRLLLRWRAIENVVKNLVVSVSVLDANGNAIYAEQSWPEDSATTSWQNGRIIHFDEHIIDIPADAAPGIYRLEVYLTDPDSWDKLPIREISSGKSLGEIFTVSAITVGASTGAMPASLAQAIHFSDEFVLADAQMAQSQEEDGTTNVDFSLRWRALRQPTKEYVVSVQALDANGRVIAQQDHAIANGFLAQQLWRERIELADNYTLNLPQDADPTALTYLLIVYNPADGARLPVTVDGIEQGDGLELNDFLMRE